MLEVNVGQHKGKNAVAAVHSRRAPETHGDHLFRTLSLFRCEQVVSTLFLDLIIFLVRIKLEYT